MNLSYDFSLSSEATKGAEDGINMLNNGKWGMIAGDGNANNIIDQEDNDMNWKKESGNQGYWQTDYNLDSQVDNQDKNEFFILNLGKQSQISQ